MQNKNLFISSQINCRRRRKTWPWNKTLLNDSSFSNYDYLPKAVCLKQKKSQILQFVLPVKTQILKVGNTENTTTTSRVDDPVTLESLKSQKEQMGIGTLRSLTNATHQTFELFSAVWRFLPKWREKGSLTKSAEREFLLIFSIFFFFFLCYISGEIVDKVS